MPYRLLGDGVVPGDALGIAERAPVVVELMPLPQPLTLVVADAGAVPADDAAEQAADGGAAIGAGAAERPVAGLVRPDVVTPIVLLRDLHEAAPAEIDRLTVEPLNDRERLGLAHRAPPMVGDPTALWRWASGAEPLPMG